DGTPPAPRRSTQTTAAQSNERLWATTWSLERGVAGGGAEVLAPSRLDGRPMKRVTGAWPTTTSPRRQPCRDALPLCGPGGAPWHHRDVPFGPPAIVPSSRFDCVPNPDRQVHGRLISTNRMLPCRRSLPSGTASPAYRGCRLATRKPVRDD